MRTIKRYGEYFVADPAICHGALTFRGTRIFVKDILDQLSEGESWRRISQEWGGRVSRPLIFDAIRLVQRCLLQQLDPRWLKADAE